MNEVNMTERGLKQNTLKSFKGFLDGSIKIPRRDCGICENIISVTGGKFDLTFYRHFKTWKYYSGNSQYPVPNPVKDSSWGPSFAYNRSFFKWLRRRWYNDMFNMKMSYSHLRWDLVKHIISEMEKELKE